DILGRHETQHPVLDAQIISVTEVRVSPDVRHAFVSVVCLDRSSQDMPPIFEALEEVSPHLRHQLAQRLQLRYTPQLRFEQDTRFDRAAFIDQLLAKTRAASSLDQDKR